jgi:hypothetical protein
LNSPGFKERRQREAGSRQVRVMDFERACSYPKHQQIPVLTYPHGIRQRDAAHIQIQPNWLKN